ncbi:chemotaxis protein CheB [Pirellulales bacterium]|nr:chemotaxis protein CheB [Pirellulales bacterium]
MDSQKRSQTLTDDKTAATTRPASPPDVPPVSGRRRFPVVCLGASAGGLEALQEFFDNMPSRSGIGFVVVTHQHRDHTSLLPELIARHTDMPVKQAADGMKVEVDHVYIAPPGSKLGILHGVLVVVEMNDRPDGKRESNEGKSSEVDSPVSLPIDYFLRSLSDDLGERAICIILSGTGSDGTDGLRAIKGRGGMAIVQRPDSARYDGMPRSAISAGLADLIMPPQEMPGELGRFVNGPYLRSEPTSIPDESMRKILLLLKARTGNDFSSYKSTTICRRIERRMNIHKIEGPNAYVKYLQQNQHETELLFKELLISVTSFFRDQEAFTALADGPLSEFIESKSGAYNFRAWVPGCATGEEAYSLAILLHELTGRHNNDFKYQIFATDLDATAIETARRGVYPDGVAQDLDNQRLTRYFDRQDSTWQVRKEIREMVVFAPQNVIKDPAFTRLDLLCCRNLLIYLEGELQQRLLPVFHYALNPGGLLILGPSETIGAASELFDVVDKRWKIFRRKDTVAAAGLPVMPAQSDSRERGSYSGNREQASGEDASSLALPLAKGGQLTKQISQLLLGQFAPASVVVAERGEIIYIHGRTGMYLEPAAGQARMNVLDMAREGLPIELATCLRQAKTDQVAACRDGVRVKTNGDYAHVNISVQRIDDPPSVRGLYLITFRPTPQPIDASPMRKRGKKNKFDDAEKLEWELQYTKESLQATIEELETSNEELTSANEELQSTNEELQSTNEELETTKEETQSLNEELDTVNTEMQCKLDELSHAHDDMQNLLNSTDIATVFLDNELCVKRFTQSARKLIKLIDSDVGRPLSDLKSSLQHDTLENDAREVLRTLVFREVEIETLDGQRYQMRIMPYRTTRNVINGLVITFVNIQPQVEAAQQRDRALQAVFESVVRTVRDPFLVLDAELCVTICNRSFYNLFGLSEQQVERNPIFKISDGVWNVQQFRTLMEDILPRETRIEDFEFTQDFPGVGRRHLLLNAHRLDLATDLPAKILLAIEDVTERR